MEAAAMDILAEVEDVVEAGSHLSRRIGGADPQVLGACRMGSGVGARRRLSGNERGNGKEVSSVVVVVVVVVITEVEGDGMEADTMVGDIVDAEEAEEVAEGEDGGELQKMEHEAGRKECRNEGSKARGKRETTANNPRNHHDHDQSKQNSHYALTCNVFCYVAESPHTTKALLPDKNTHKLSPPSPFPYNLPSPCPLFPKSSCA